jgi:hypothetical protein
MFPIHERGNRARFSMVQYVGRTRTHTNTHTKEEEEEEEEEK